MTIRRPVQGAGPTAKHADSTPKNAMSATPSAPNPHVPQLLSARSPVIIRPLAKDGMSAAPPALTPAKSFNPN